MRLGLLAFAAIFVCAPACADATSERSFPQTVAEVQSALKNLAGGTAGSLPVLDGFVASSVTGLEQYQRPNYRCSIMVAPVASGGSRVRVSAKITAWHNSGAKSGYDVLPSNGRLESDLLDRLQQALTASPGAAVAPQDLTSTTKRTMGHSDQPGIDAPTVQFPKFDPKASAQNLGTDDPALQREAENLSEILRNQSHPTNLVAVKSNQTPVLQNPALDAKVLFLASAEDEFEIIEQNPDWIHIRISGLSRGWLRRSGVELLDDSESVQAESPGTGVAAGNTPTPASRRAKAASPFSVSSEEVGNFPGEWAPLKGKSVKIVSAQSAPGSGVTSAEDKLKFAETTFQKQGMGATSAGLVVVFDTEDGGMIAATASSIEQYKKGAISEEAFWKQCYVDPPEVLGSAK